MLAPTPETEINNLNKRIVDFRNEVNDQKKIIAQYNIDLDEIEFLRLNLKFGHTCRKSFLNNKYFKKGVNYENFLKKSLQKFKEYRR